MQSRPQKVTPTGPARLRTALLVVGLATVGATEMAAQRVVMVHDEPHHRLVVNDADLKVLDIQIIPGDTTMMHTHEGPIIYTYISSGTGPSGGRVTSVTRYLTEPQTHEVTNPGPGLFRILALGHYGDGAAEGVRDAAPTGMPVEPSVEDQWFRSYRIALDPGEETPMIRHSNPALVIQVTDGHTDVSKQVGYGADLTRMGDWTWREAGTSYRIRNAGSTPVEVVINEGRRPD